MRENGYLKIKEQLGSILEASNDAITVQDFNGNILLWSRGAEKTYGYSENEALKMNISQITPRKCQKEIQHVIQDIKDGKVIDSFETTRIKKDGGLIPVWISFSVLKESEESPIGFLTIERDIEERKLSEQREWANKKEISNLESHKANFMRKMSHEFRTPLHAILGFNEIITTELRQIETPPNVLEYLDKIKVSATHILNLVDNILHLEKVKSRAHRPVVEGYSIAELIREVSAIVEPIIQKNDNLFDVEFDKKIGNIRTDVLKLRQILINLLSNAGKFTKNGEVSISVEKHQEGLNNYFVFKVKDTGTGIKNEFLDKVFDEFTQGDHNKNSEHAGSGLGLAICKKFAELMEGTLEVESVFGEGATFTLKLPEEIKFDLIKTPEIKQPLIDRNLRILVADDTQENIILLKHFVYRWY